MANFALVKNGVVMNVIVATNEFIDKIRSEWDEIVELGLSPETQDIGLGWVKEKEVFEMPNKPSPEDVFKGDLRKEALLRLKTLNLPAITTVAQLKIVVDDIMIAQDLK